MSGFDSRQITQLLWADEKTGRAETPEALQRKVPDLYDDAAKQKWKEDAPMIKARGKRKEVPPPDDETKAKYEACRARVELPSHLRRATNNPANAGSKRSTPSRRTPRISKRSSGATRRPSRLSSRPSDAPLAARRLATVPCYDRERAASLREGDAASGGATRRRKSPFWKQTHFTRRGRGRAARVSPPISPQVLGPT